MLWGRCLNIIGFKLSGPGDFLLLKSLKTCVSLSLFIQSLYFLFMSDVLHLISGSRHPVMRLTLVGIS